MHGNAKMAVFTISPTVTDVGFARAISAHTDVPTEDTAEALTWGADEHVLIALAAARWLYSRNSSREWQGAANHVLRRVTGYGRSNPTGT